MLELIGQFLSRWFSGAAWSKWTGPDRGREKAPKTVERRRRPGGRRGTDSATAKAEKGDGQPSAQKAEEGEVALPMPEPVTETVLESPQILSGPLLTRQREILDRIGERIERGQFDLPHLPSTSMVVMDLAANPSSEIPEIVETLSTDPVLSTRLLRMANSALYATQEPVETIHEAIMRVGMRELRSLILALSMRQVIFRNGKLTNYAEETWRQAYSVAVISRSIAEPCSMPADKLFLLGLLHDVGKIALLSMLQREIKDTQDVTPTLVGRAFLEYHEHTGSLMAEGWKLSEEFISVAGCHHNYENNEQYARSAAVVSLAHRLDMNLSSGDASVYWRASSYPELEFLGLNPDAQTALIATAHEAFMENLEDSPTKAA